MKLIIAEKPSVAKDIAESLFKKIERKKGYFLCDDDYAVTYAVGHLYRLAEPDEIDSRFKKWNMSDLPLDFDVEFKPNEKTHDQLKVVNSLINRASEIYNACDPDNAGAAIFDLIIMMHNNVQATDIHRVLINDNNPELIKKAFNQVQPNSDFYRMTECELSRQVSDQRFGFSLTRAFTLTARQNGFDGSIQIGRVSTATLGLVIFREQAIKNHEVQYYFIFQTNVENEDGTIVANYKIEDDDTVDDSGRLIDEDEIKNKINNIKDKPARLTRNETKRKTESPPLPFSLLRLQAECAKLFGLTPKQTLEVTQSLRENYKAITYNRSDCSFLSSEDFALAPDVISNLKKCSNLTEMAESANTSIKSRAFDSTKVTAHHAIRPTGNVSGYEKMSETEKNVFDLISKFYIAQFYPKREIDVTKVDFDIDGHTFNGTIKNEINAGWKVIVSETEDEEDENPTQIDPKKLVLSHNFEHKPIMKNQKTKPPSLYTMRTLLNDMANTAKFVKDPTIKKMLLEKDAGNPDKGGIGTPATRDTIIQKLFDQGYLIENKQKKIELTEKGNLIGKIVPNEILIPSQTAVWADMQKSITQGDIDMNDFLDSVDEFIFEQVQTLKENGLSIPDELKKKEQEGIECPNCNEKTIISKRKGKFGEFWPCGNCKTIFDNHRNSPFLKKCGACNGQLKIRVAKKNKKKFTKCVNEECAKMEWM